VCFADCVNEYVRQIANETWQAIEHMPAAHLPPNVPMKVWHNVAHRLCERIAAAGSGSDVKLSDFLRELQENPSTSKLAIDASTLGSIVHALEERDVVRTFGAGGAASFHAPAQFRAWRKHIAPDVWAAAFSDRSPSAFA
jgi:hypothetical protein